MKKKTGLRGPAVSAQEAEDACRKEREKWGAFQEETRRMSSLAIPLSRCSRLDSSSELGPAQGESWRSWADRVDVEGAIESWLVRQVIPACDVICDSEWSPETLLDVHVGRKPDVLIKSESFLAGHVLQLIRARGDTGTLKKVSTDISDAVKNEPGLMEHFLRYFKFLAAKVTGRRPDEILDYDCELQPAGEVAKEITEADAQPALSELQQRCLVALLEMEAVDSDSRLLMEKVAMRLGIDCDPDNLKSPFKGLRDYGFTGSQKGPGGGLWLRQPGIERAKKLQGRG